MDIINTDDCLKVELPHFVKVGTHILLLRQSERVGGSGCIVAGEAQ